MSKGASQSASEMINSTMIYLYKRDQFYTLDDENDVIYVTVSQLLLVIVSTFPFLPECGVHTMKNTR